MSRRDLLKLAFAGAGAVAIGSQFAATPADASCVPYSGTTAWGTHNLTAATAATAGKPPQDFYIWEGGSEFTPETGLFDSTAASEAAPGNTFMYWNPYGALAKPYGPSYYAFGQSQAEQAYETYLTGTYGFNNSWTCGQTLFAVISAADPRLYNGWTSGSATPYTANAEVLNGWLDYIAGTGLNNGIYTSVLDWNAALVSTLVPSQPFVLWVDPACWAGCNSSVPNVCAPCKTTCTTTECDVKNYLSNIVNVAVIGGQRPVLWHYWNGCSPCSAHDYDVSIQDPTLTGRFTPRTTSAGQHDCGGGCSTTC